MISTFTKGVRLIRTFASTKPLLPYLTGTPTPIRLRTLTATHPFTQYKNISYPRSKPTLLKYHFSVLTPEQIQEKIQDFENFDFSMKLSKDQEDNKIYADGMKYLQQKNWPKASQMFAKLIEKDPNNYGLHLYVGLISEYHDARDVLIKNFQRALEIDPTHPTNRKLRAKLARNYLKTPDKHEKGHQIYIQLIEEQPTDWGMEMHYGISIQLSDPIMCKLVEALEAGENLHKAGEKQKVYEVLKAVADQNYPLNDKTKRAMRVIYKHLVNTCEELNKHDEAFKYKTKLDALGVGDV